MSRVCALTGKKVQFGHNVSHSNRKTNRRFQPNLQKVVLESEVLGHGVPMRISTRALRTVQKKGGLDLFLLKTADKDLAEEALRWKRRIAKRLGAGASSQYPQERKPRRFYPGCRIGAYGGLVRQAGSLLKM